MFLLSIYYFCYLGFSGLRSLHKPNDSILTRKLPTVVSCSSDCTVALSFYDADAQQFQVKSTIISHSDYVKKLCARGRDIYSAGLDSTVCVHHIREAAISSEMINAKHSIYSLGVSGAYDYFLCRRYKLTCSPPR
jgi:hypothetical protein